MNNELEVLSVDADDKAWFAQHAYKRCLGCLVFLEHKDYAQVTEQLQNIRGGARALGFRQLASEAAVALLDLEKKAHDQVKVGLESLSKRLEALCKKWKSSRTKNTRRYRSTEVTGAQ